MPGLFTSDDELRAAQRQSARIPKGTSITPEALRAEHLADERELREHGRWRQFAFLLFIVPAIFTLLSLVMGYAAMHLAASRAESFIR